VVATIVGYRLIHSVAAVLSVVAGGALVVAFVWMVGVNGVPAENVASGGFSWGRVHGDAVGGALWQIAYAPYVSDYTRYMPKDTGAAGRVLGTTPDAFSLSVAMLLGVLVGRVARRRDARWALHTDPRVSTGLFAIFAIGITATNAMIPLLRSAVHDHGGQTPVSAWRPALAAAQWTANPLFSSRSFPRTVSAEDFLANYANFLPCCFVS